MYKNLIATTLIPFILTLTACGGGSNPPANTAPIVNAGIDSTVDEGNGITLSGSGSDSDGSISSYSWTQESGTPVAINNSTSSTASFDITTTAQAILTFKLTATDNDGLTGHDTIRVTVQPLNIKPLVNAGINRTVDEGNGITLSGSGSDSDGSISSYSWTQESGTPVELNFSDTENTQFIMPLVSSDETLTFKLTVTDNEGGSEIDLVDVHVYNISKNSINDTGILLSSYNDSCDSSILLDCHLGRDVDEKNDLLDKVGGGEVGFDFTKLDINGNALDESSLEWSCVRDNQTGLIWEVKTTSDDIHDANNMYRWGGVTSQGRDHPSRKGDYFDDWNELVNESNENELCGSFHWRVPTINELSDISHLGATSPKIDINYFPNTKSDDYWSSIPDSYAGFSQDLDRSARYIDFSRGLEIVHRSSRSNYKHVRLVSDIKAKPKSTFKDQTQFEYQTVFTYIDDNAPTSRYILNNNGTAIDKETGLMWMRCTVGRVWNIDTAECDGDKLRADMRYDADALKLVIDSNFANHTDWRIPNIKELKTLVAYNLYNATINQEVFVDAANFDYVSSTYYEGSQLANYFYGIDFRDGKEIRSLDGYYFLVRDNN